MYNSGTRYFNHGLTTLYPGLAASFNCPTVFPRFLGSRLCLSTFKTALMIVVFRHYPRAKLEMGIRKVAAFDAFLFSSTLGSSASIGEQLTDFPAPINYGGDNALAPMMGKEGREDRRRWLCMSKKNSV